MRGGVRERGGARAANFIVLVPSQFYNSMLNGILILFEGWVSVDVRSSVRIYLLVFFLYPAELRRVASSANAPTRRSSVFT